MARKSFTLQKITPNYGSYTQYPSGSAAASVGLAVRADDDTKLKADGILVAPILDTPVSSGGLLSFVSFFDVSVVDYGENHLSWDAPLVDLTTVVSPYTVVPTVLVLVYSESGEPETISDGQTLMFDNRTREYTHYVTPGKWAYYTLFVKFESRDGDLYYEPAATISVLSPKNYGSAKDLFKKIPEHYRLLDSDLDEGSGGPLERYLSIFGFEIDRVRTTIDYVISCKDPQVADSEVLDYLAQDLGVDLQSRELGASRLRSLLDIIGYLRRSEGTATSIELALQAITGSDIEFDYATNTIKVYAQRVNLLKDPNLKRVLSSLFDAGSPSSTVFSLQIDSGVPGTASFTTTYSGGTPSATGGTVIGNELWSYDPDLSSGGSVNVLQTTSGYIRAKGGDTLYFSVQSGLGSLAQESVTKVELYSGAPYGGASATLVASQATSTTLGGIKYWGLTVPDSVTAYTNMYLSIFQLSTVDAPQHFSRMLLERQVGGLFFDGDTTFGGWLVDGNTISDYRWYNPAAPNGASPGLPIENFSVYNSNYQKTRAVVTRLIPQLLPVTELTTGTSPVYSNGAVPSPRWSVTYNHIPGV